MCVELGEGVQLCIEELQCSMGDILKIRDSLVSLCYTGYAILVGY